jgi:2-polyprenyl-6-methoxyphenol hydroxylase-like FAD-dependent oxidoreductase
MHPTNPAVLIAGGGPCGLTLANELGRRNVTVLMVDEKPGTAQNPQANATQARTMEHFRRLGFANEIRQLGLPPDYPTDIAYFSRFATHELARFRLPSAREAVQKVNALSGSWSAAELPHRVSQKYVEAILREHAQKLPGVVLHYGWRLLHFRDEGERVQAEIECVASGERQVVHAAWLVGADGARSRVRQQLGFRYTGETGIDRDFMGGRMLALYVRAPELYRLTPHAPAWMHVSFNRERRAFMAAVDGKGEFAFHTQLRPGENEADISDADARAMFQAACGIPVPVEILSRGTWTAGHSLVADHFQRGRVFIGGDAAHLFTPTGGLGYNTAVEDAVNLGWKLAAVHHGWAAPALLESYEVERRPLALRNTGYARRFADSLGLFAPDENIERDTELGVAARRIAGQYLEAHRRAEFDIPGITFGGRYDGSPAIVSDGSAAPPDTPNIYVPTACPGGRAPHFWLADGRSLFDLFGFEWTLLRLHAAAGQGEHLRDMAARLGMPLKTVDLDLPSSRELYQAPLVLIRPDQIVAWRGEHDDDAEGVLQQLLGRGTQTTCDDSAVGN